MHNLDERERTLGTSFGQQPVGRGDCYGDPGNLQLRRLGGAQFHLFKSFAAGMLVAVSILHLIPKAFSLSGHPSYFILCAFLVVYLLDHLLGTSARKHGRPARTLSGLIPLIAIGFHSLLDGVIYSVTFRIDTFTGFLTAIGMILHEFPEGIITFVFVSEAGFSKGRAFLLAFLTAAISTPVGAMISYPFIADIDQLMLGRLLALAAGALLFVGTAHLLPEVKKAGKTSSLAALAGGIVLAVGLILVRGG
jgi:zinc transporter ZupT